MVLRLSALLWRAAALLAAGVPSAHAHHVMDYAAPVTLLDGLLSGLGHPVIGVDHLLFIAGAGVLAAQLKRGWMLPLVFVAASVAAAGLRAAGAALVLSELWVAGSLVLLGAIMLIAREPGRGVVAGLFLVSGALHGYALAESIVGAERTPLIAYFAGLTIIQCAIAFGSWWAASWLSAHCPRVPLRRAAGAVVGAAGLVFAGMAAFS